MTNLIVKHQRWQTDALHMMPGPQPSPGAVACVPRSVPFYLCHTCRPSHNAKQRQITTVGTNKIIVMYQWWWRLERLEQGLLLELLRNLFAGGCSAGSDTGGGVTAEMRSDTTTGTGTGSWSSSPGSEDLSKLD